jgi:hypothetical protein
MAECCVEYDVSPLMHQGRPYGSSFASESEDRMSMFAGLCLAETRFMKVTYPKLSRRKVESNHLTILRLIMSFLFRLPAGMH